MRKERARECLSHAEEVYEYDTVVGLYLVPAECSANLCTARADVDLRKSKKTKTKNTK